MGWSRHVMGCVVAASCVACAGPSTTIPGLSSEELASERHKQRLLLIQTHYVQLARVNKVGYRIAHAGRRDCKEDVTYDLGFSTVAPNDLPELQRELATEALGQDPGTSFVISVAEGSPAANAGIAVGDRLVSLNGQRVIRTKPADWIALFLLKNGSQPVSVEVERDGQMLTRTMTAVERCSIPIRLKTDVEVNAMTNGSEIVVYSGMLRVTPTDDELAVILGHELAHANLGHLKKRNQNRIAGSIGGAIVDIGFALLGLNTGGTFTRGFGNAGVLAYYTDFEREADYVGAYYAAWAEYDLSVAERVWRTTAQEDPKQMIYSGLHPASPERFLLIRKTAEEIAGKKRRGDPLVPEPRPATTTAAAPEQTPTH